MFFPLSALSNFFYYIFHSSDTGHLNWLSNWFSVYLHHACRLFFSLWKFVIMNEPKNTLKQKNESYCYHHQTTIHYDDDVPYVFKLIEITMSTKNANSVYLVSSVNSVSFPPPPAIYRFNLISARGRTAVAVSSIGIGRLPSCMQACVSAYIVCKRRIFILIFHQHITHPKEAKKVLLLLIVPLWTLSQPNHQEKCAPFSSLLKKICPLVVKGSKVSLWAREIWRIIDQHATLLQLRIVTD